METHAVVIENARATRLQADVGRLIGTAITCLLLEVTWCEEDFGARF